MNIPCIEFCCLCYNLFTGNVLPRVGVFKINMLYYREKKRNDGEENDKASPESPEAMEMQDLNADEEEEEIVYDEEFAKIAKRKEVKSPPVAPLTPVVKSPRVNPPTPASPDPGPAILQVEAEIHTLPKIKDPPPIPPRSAVNRQLQYDSADAPASNTRSKKK